ncbi:Uncharacterised protein [Enterobacter hormaechei]|nr:MULTISPECIES: hypothetical protein [Enterobacteriaceae]MCE9985185.1 hypothetical protein [Leclercia adecarboxylata]VAE21230.1 Uncharacterised protein [Enterobacter hormaechei]VAE26836.1 Uncharacterised protein [Enterobacter hormaechei]
MSDMIVKAPSKRRPAAARDSSSDPGMLKLQIIPSTQEFNNFLRDDKDYILRRLTKVSMAITSLFKTINPVTDKDLVDKLEEWLDVLLTEREELAKSSARHITMLKEQLDEQITKNLIYTPQTFEPVQIHFNNGNTGRFIRHLNTLNNLMLEMHKLYLVGEVKASDIKQYHKNILADARVCVDTIAKTLSVSKRDRENGRYIPEIFIEKIRLYKSVQDYYNAEINRP